MNTREETKIFGIGFHKTGTSSLAAALTELGYSVTGPNGVWDSNIQDKVYSMAYDLADQYDAFQDNPWPLVYKEMDKRYLGSKFILTIRDTDEWLDSVLRHFEDAPSPMREWIYGVGSPKGNEDIFIKRYERHNREVMDYFRGRPDDILVLRITDGEGWKKLCSFLGKEVPGTPFPHANKASSRRKKHFIKIYNRIKKKMKVGLTGERS